MRSRSSSHPILNISGLTIRRDNHPILQQIDWRVEPGQHWVLLGANGSGKTSLLAALTGYLMPSAGEIEMLGERFGESDWRALRTRIGIVSSSIRQLMAETEPALDTVASGRYAMIDFWGTPSRTDRSAARKLLREVDCEPLADRPWAVLSQGERQRILIARALMARPRLLILDEPCAGLDPVAREHFLEFIQRLGSKPSAPTLLLVTHHVEEIMPVFTHGLMLRGGRSLGAGPLADVLTSAKVSALFGGRVRLSSSHGRWNMRVQSPSKRIV
jgi:iron complex transport system ATP-binding protein